MPDRLGRTQRLVLLLIGDDAKSVRTLAYDHPALTESSARAAVTRLFDRGYLDRAYRGSVMHYHLTAKGRAAEQAGQAILDA